MMEVDETLVAQQQVIRLQALLEASRMIHSTIVLAEVVDTMLEIVVRELELTGAYCTTFPNSYGEGAEEASRTLNAELSTRFALHDKSGGVLTELVVIRPAERELTLDELDFLQSLAVQGAVAIENARFHERTVEWQRIEGDLASARQVQRSLLPQEMPNIPGYGVSIRSVACYEVGGDYLDIVPLGANRTIIVVADVAGKGLASALVGSSFRSAFRAMVNSGVPLLDIATRMNLLHYGEGEQSRRRYVTAIFFELDSAAHTVRIVNAGHNPAFLVEGESRASEAGGVKKIGASGTPIGLLPFSSYKLETYAMRPNARLLVYTDGMTEVFRGEEEFGEDRLLHSFIRCESVHSEGVLDALWTTLDEFSDGQEQSDDMTALVLVRGRETRAGTEALG